MRFIFLKEGGKKAREGRREKRGRKGRWEEGKKTGKRKEPGKIMSMIPSLREAEAGGS